MPAALAGMCLPVRRAVDHALKLLGAREVEYEMSAPERRSRLPSGRDDGPATTQAVPVGT
jgi:hypothetical protein